ncbi:MAG: hypothetical protein ABIY55_29550 [Kofleriaceae bacterium]
MMQLEPGLTSREAQHRVAPEGAARLPSRRRLDVILKGSPLDRNSGARFPTRTARVDLRS